MLEKRDRYPDDVVRFLNRSEQSDAYEDFQHDAYKKAKQYLKKRGVASSMEATLQAVQEATRGVTITSIADAIGRLIELEKIGVLEVDREEGQPRVAVTLPDEVQLYQGDNDEAIRRGISAGVDDVFDLLVSVEVCASGKVKAPLIPWKRTFAPLVLDDVIEDSGQLLGYRRTRIPGLRVQYLYDADKIFPERRLESDPETIGEDLNRLST